MAGAQRNSRIIFEPHYMKYTLLVLLLITGNIAFSQVNDASPFTNYIDTAELRSHLYNIASPEMEGRETATPGQRKAAAYIEEQFRAKGLTGGWNNSYQQIFPVYQDSMIRSQLSINGASLRNDTDFVVSNTTRYNVGLNTNSIVFAGYGIADTTRNDYDKINARGKIVLVMPGAAPVGNKGKKRPGRIPGTYTLQKAAFDNGAAALLIVDDRFPRSKGSAKGPMYLTKDANDSLPFTVFISDSVARQIMGSDYKAAVAANKSGSPLHKEYTVQTAIVYEQQTEKLESSNVIGILEGTSKKDEAIVITAHYDHMGKKDSLIFYGADDDGSGTVTILELADAFTKAKAAGAGPKRSIIFMTVSGEEKGLWGSAYYAANPAFPMEKTSVNINIDMVGRIESRRKEDSLSYIYVVGDNRLSSDLRPISEAANKKLYNFTLDYKFNDPNDPQRIYYRSDHYNFAKNGVPAIFYFNGLHDDYHRPTDTPDKINYPLLAKRAQLIFHTAWEMANRDEMLKRDLE